MYPNKIQPNEPQPVSPEKRYATMLMLWGAMFFNLAIFFLLTKLTVAERASIAGSHPLSLGLMTGGALAVLFSIVLRPKLVARAVEQQNPTGVQSAYIIAFAISEVAAICGVLLHFLTNERSYYLLFIIAAAGFLFNFPRRSDVINASSKRSV